MITGFGDQRSAIELYPPYTRKNFGGLETATLLFRFFMRGVFSAPAAIFLEFQFSFHQFFVFSGPVVDAFAGTALHFN